MTEHAHAVSAAVTGLSALPGAGKPFSSVLAMCRFLNHDAVTPAALVEPVQDAVRQALADAAAPVALVAHDWCMFSFHTHTSKTDRYRRSHEHDLGYELSTALVIDPASGRPLGPMELRLRTADALLTTRPGGAAEPPGHLDELTAVMAEAARWDLGRPAVHVIDAEADSVAHYRRWAADGRLFLVRADVTRRVTWRGDSALLRDVIAALALQFRDIPEPSGRPLRAATRAGDGRVQVVETAVVLDRPAKATVNGKKVEVPGPPLPLRLILTRVVGGTGVVLAEWLLFTNAPAVFDAAEVARWYCHRWRIETYHKLLKTAGQNAEQWQQETGDAFFNRLIVATMSCLTVWHLRQDDSADATRLKAVLIRLSGRQMKWKAADTAPALLAGLEKLLALVNLMATDDLADILALARRVLPTLFPTG